MEISQPEKSREAKNGVRLKVDTDDLMRQKKKISVKIGTDRLQETYHSDNDSWNFMGLEDHPDCDVERTFWIEREPKGTAIKACKNEQAEERYLSIEIDGWGVPISNPSFTSTSTTASSDVVIKGNPVQISRFTEKSEKSEKNKGLTSFSFTVKYQKGTGTFYLIPGQNSKIAVMETEEAQYVFKVEEPSSSAPSNDGCDCQLP